jgi:thioredoxin 1
MNTTNSNLTVVNDATFVDEVVNAPGITVAKFSAEWCGPCHMLAPIVEAIAATHGDKAKFVNVDADASPAASVKFGVRGLPTVLFFRNGEAVSRVVGAVPRARLEAELAQLL